VLYAKQESEFIAAGDTMDLTKARESMLDLLSEFLKQDPTFNNIAYW
jgi:hypothetical protein